MVSILRPNHTGRAVVIDDNLLDHVRVDKERWYLAAWSSHCADHVNISTTGWLILLRLGHNVRTLLLEHTVAENGFQLRRLVNTLTNMVGWASRAQPQQVISVDDTCPSTTEGSVGSVQAVGDVERLTPCAQPAAIESMHVRGTLRPVRLVHQASRQT